MELVDIRDLSDVTSVKVLHQILKSGKCRFACSYKRGLSDTFHLWYSPT